jgi:hypothetical protein
MAKILRKLQKLFASNGTLAGVFGSGQLGTKVKSTNLDTLQGLSAWLNGWASSVLSGEKLPPLEEFNCMGYVFSQQIAYLLQEGVAEYLSTKEYHQNSIVKKAGTNELYSSLINTNTGNALPSQVSDANWQYLGDLGELSQATESKRGTGEIATQTETTTGTDDTRFITPLKLAGLYGNSLRTANGYERQPVKVSGAFVEMITQWGEEASYHDVTTQYNATLTFPITFPNATLRVMTNFQGNGTIGNDDDIVGVHARSITTSNFVIAMGEHTPSTNSVKGTYLAKGY